MQLGKWVRKLAHAGIAVCVFALMFAGSPNKTEAATGFADFEVTYGVGTVIGNSTFAAENGFLNFFADAGTGFKQTLDSEYANLNPDSGDMILGLEDKGTTVKFEIKIADNPQLKALAQSGHARVETGFQKLVYLSGLGWTAVSSINVKLDGVSVLSYSSHGGSVYDKSDSAIISPDSVITIEAYGEGDNSDIFSGADDWCGVRGFYIKFVDDERPVLEGYTFTGNGTDWHNPNNNKQELYIKETENITLQYEFSEKVQGTAFNPGYYDHFLKHPLFVNPDGTGLPAAGQQQYLVNQTYNSSNRDSYQTKIAFKYTGVKYHHSGNNPLTPKIKQPADGMALIDMNMQQKMVDAGFADAAGNMADMTNIIKSTNSSNEYLRGKTVDPFDYQNGGYRVIADSVAPKYSKGGNGIQPEVLTGAVLNKNDTIDFTLQLSEEAKAKKGLDITKTFIKFNNGMKAYYVDGDNKQNWTFRMTIPAGEEVEAPLLKVLAVSNDSKGNDSDLDVIQDYAGNMLIQPADFDGSHEDGDVNLVNSKIDWAQLAIDNTKPTIAFTYESGGANATTYSKTGKITIAATDPQVKVPALDPVVADRGKLKPSKGIYRPSNMTGSSSPSLGLVYYVWSQDSQNPFESVASDNFAAIKRYSLSAKQPSEELYPGQFQNVSIQVTNNLTNMVVPPVEALTAAGSGEWYLHTWTADMTWDAAREMMQYEKKKTYVQNNPATYAAWKAEASGSDADRTFYADNKAMAAVGQYGNLTNWPLDNFKSDDSNWTYASATIKFDNKKPDISFADPVGDDTYNVSVEASVSDPQSGLKNVFYQWVKYGQQPAAIDWKTATLAAGKVTLASLNEVTEDGKYWLYVKSADNAGNESTVKTTNFLTVNSEQTVIGSFTPAPNEDYVKSHDITFKLVGANPSKVAYALTASAVKPTTESAYTTLTAEAGGNSTQGRFYKIPENTAKNGIVYVHMLVKEGSNNYYYSKAYYFDNQAPVVSFSKNGSAYPQAKHELTVTVTESYSVTGLAKKYMWVKDGLAAPTAQSAGWINLPADGVVFIDGTGLTEGQIVDYKLYVWVVDGAENSTIKGTENTFKVSKTGPQVPAEAADSDLIYLYGDADAGFTAIVKLNLTAVDKAGYEYSISPDNGESWVKWRAFTNFVSLSVPTGNPADLQIIVKYRNPGGAFGEAVKMKTGGDVSQEPIYALASLRHAGPINATAGEDIDITVPVGMKVVPSAVNPSVPVRTGNSFNVKTNGFYSFDVSDLADPARKDTLFIIVSNVDGTPPTAEFEYFGTAPTSGSVTAKLSPSEPIRIVNNDGRNAYTFQQNGSFTFQFVDEAGNPGSATAVVANIDKSAPAVKIVRSYTYGENGENTFGSIEDGNGNVLLSSGVVLSLEKTNPSGKDFHVVEGKPIVTLSNNGTVKFVVADDLGNTVVLTQEVNNVISAPPQADMTYKFVDEDGVPIPDNKIVTIDGVKYAKGKVEVTLSGETEAPNKVFSGVIPLEDDNGDYTNQLSDEDGAYTYSRQFSANGSTTLALTDLLGNVSKLPVTVSGLDNTPPEIKLNKRSVGITRNKANFNFKQDLGGFSATDNLSAAADIQVNVSGLDLNQLGRQTVTYKAVDQVGNETVVYQDVVVISGEGILIFANGTLISGSSGESALFDTNKLTFTIDRFNLVNVNGVSTVNERGTFDVLYQPGLYREGQMKYIASKVTYQELVSGQYTITFPQAGWYTIVVRNQEREREFATFFISKTGQ